MVDLLDDATLTTMEREHPAGLSSQEILDIFKAAGNKLSEATLRKYVQLGLLPRSVRVGKKGKHQGSQGLYPATVVRRIVRIRVMMAQDFTIEQIQTGFLFVRGDIEELDRALAKVFCTLDSASKEKSREIASKTIANDILNARALAHELIDTLTAIEARLTVGAQLSRVAG